MGSLASDEEWGDALHQLHAVGLTKHPRTPEFHFDTGHWVTLADPRDEEGGNPQWSIHVKHPGDPAGSWFRSDLGTSGQGIGERVIRELAHPDIVREMGAQVRRAEQDGSPGWEPHAGPGRFAGRPSAIFRHYG